MTKDEYKKYQGTAETSSKERYNNHTRNVKHKKYMKRTKPSKYIWSLKNQGITPIVKWGIVKKVKFQQITANYA